jgi:hypothetical protein
LPPDRLAADSSDPEVLDVEVAEDRFHGQFGERNLAPVESTLILVTAL